MICLIALSDSERRLIVLAQLRPPKPDNGLSQGFAGVHMQQMSPPPMVVVRAGVIIMGNRVLTKK